MPIRRVESENLKKCCGATLLLPKDRGAEEFADIPTSCRAPLSGPEIKVAYYYAYLFVKLFICLFPLTIYNPLFTICDHKFTTLKEISICPTKKISL